MMMRVMALILVVLLELQPVLACSHCSSTSSDLYTQLRDAKAVALAQRVGVKKYRVDKSLKGKAQVGSIVIAAGSEKHQEPYLFLTTSGATTLPWTGMVLPLDEDGLAFVKSALHLDGASDDKVWDLATRHLESSSEEVAVACYNMLATAPLGEIKERGAKLGRDRLLGLVKTDRIPEQRRALYMLMALPCLQPADKAWLRKALFTPPNKALSPLLAPLLMGYLQVTGPEGIEEAQRTFFKPEYHSGQTVQANNAMLSLGESAESKTLREASRAFFRVELRHPKRGFHAIAPLAIWKDYSVAAEVEKLAGRGNATWTRVAAIRYFRTFSSAEAREALARLSATDRALVAKTTHPYRPGDLRARLLRSP